MSRVYTSISIYVPICLHGRTACVQQKYICRSKGKLITFLKSMQWHNFHSRMRTLNVSSNQLSNLPVFARTSDDSYGLSELYAANNSLTFNVLVTIAGYVYTIIHVLTSLTFCISTIVTTTLGIVLGGGRGWLVRQQESNFVSCRETLRLSRWFTIGG